MIKISIYILDVKKQRKLHSILKKNLRDSTWDVLKYQ